MNARGGRGGDVSREKNVLVLKLVLRIGNNLYHIGQIIKVMTCCRLLSSPSSYLKITTQEDFSIVIGLLGKIFIVYKQAPSC